MDRAPIIEGGTSCYDAITCALSPIRSHYRGDKKGDDRAAHNQSSLAHAQLEPSLPTSGG